MSDDEAMTYEHARDELADVVRRLEAGGLTLEESLALWERGERLAAVCEEWLAGARARLASATTPPPSPTGPSSGDAEGGRVEREGEAGVAPPGDETPF